ncbi:MAG TPA: hypothetical protein VM943_00505 [Pyrinomonadaceae bacterium]|nr:hypothetical protein [Pyrinomonadaceae bacterium]
MRAELRPWILSSLAHLYKQESPTTDQQIDVLEFELRLNEIDNYSNEVDEIIYRECPPPPAQFREPVFREEEVSGDAFATAIAELFFSAESKTNVHGPVMLYHAATLAERLLRPSEQIVKLGKTSFKKMVVCQMRFFVCDAERGYPAEALSLLPTASIVGSFLLSSGRPLEFFGVQISGRPVTETAYFNSFALKVLPALNLPEDSDLYHVTKSSDLYSVKLRTTAPLSEIPAGGFTVPLCLMTLLDIMMIVMVTYRLHAQQTKLLLAVNELPLMPDPVNELASGVMLEIRPRTDKTRVWKENFLLMPIDFRFSPLQKEFSRLYSAETDLPYYKIDTE